MSPSFDIYDNGMPCRVNLLSADSVAGNSKITALGRLPKFGQTYHSRLQKAEIYISHLFTHRHELFVLQIEVRQLLNFGIQFQGHSNRIFAGCLYGAGRISENNTWTELREGQYFYRSGSYNPLWQLHLQEGICTLIVICKCDGVLPSTDFAHTAFSPKIWIVLKKLPDFILEKTRHPQLDNWIAILINDANNSLYTTQKWRQPIPFYFIEKAFIVGDRIIMSFDSFDTLTQISGQKDLSNRNFKKAFLGLFSCTPKQLQKRIRMQKATELLNAGTPVEKVAQLLGYAHVRDFKKTYLSYFRKSAR